MSPPPRPHTPASAGSPTRILIGLAAAVSIAVVGCGGSSTKPEDSTAAPAAEAPKQPTPEEVEGVTADEVLKRLADAYQGAENYYDNAEYHERSVYRDQGTLNEPPPHIVSIAFSRPDRVRVGHEFVAADDRGLNVTLTSDGDRLRVKSSDQPEKVIDRPAPEPLTADALTADDEINQLLFPVPLENLYPQLDLLLSGDEAPSRLIASADARLLPSDSLNEVACYRLRLDRPAGPYIAWVDKETSMLRRLEIPTAEVRRQHDPDDELLRLELWIDFNGAQFDAKMGSEVFQIGPDEGVELVESFTADKAADATVAAEDSPGDESQESNPQEPQTD